MSVWRRVNIVVGGSCVCVRATRLAHLRDVLRALRFSHDRVFFFFSSSPISLDALIFFLPPLPVAQSSARKVNRAGYFISIQSEGVGEEQLVKSRCVRFQ